MKHLRALIIILVLLLIVIVAVQNHPALSTQVQFKVDLKFWSGQTVPLSLYVVAVFTFLIGVLIAGLYGAVERFRLRREIKTLIRQGKQKDEELNTLRNLPVTSEVVPNQGLEELP